ncbi:hypothetical protein [Stenotrophomonas sp. 278]|uniref:hypothetical protein n=1 Tax=Stenotrophomonas sp. 278 TaxID=2479851 RepID=UPI000F67B939|nr:hypothetical protein [Stenotrophomonas sp. 278]RRU23567.1 hypothetical protein EGJ34_02680 [Stenotrophomonas sp. 278]
MIAGLEVNDAAGQPVISVTDRLPRTLGTVWTGTTSGSVGHAGLEQGEPWFTILGQEIGYVSPEVSFSGTTMTWTFESAVTAFRDNCLILYGVR